MSSKSADVSIIIPHYKTESLARLCLRSIRHYTKELPEVIVVDNGSGDDPSLEYLRQVEWIKLIERKENIGKAPADAHKEAMDMGIAASTKPFILSFHTDTIAVHPEWLDWLTLQLEQTPETAAVGSYKLEIKSKWQLCLKSLEDILGLGQKAQAGTSENPMYIRSHCALYRKDALEKLNLHFISPETAGRNIHFGLIEGGYQAQLLPVHQMLRYVVHLNHGTMVMLPELGARKKTIRKGRGRIHRFLETPQIQKIYNNEALDKK